MQTIPITNYSIQVLLYLFIHGKTSAKVISENLNIPRRYVHMVLKEEALSELLCTGEYGNYWLKRGGDTISLLDIIKLLEKKISDSSSLELSKERTLTYDKGYYSVIKQFEQVNNEIETILSSITLDDLRNKTKAEC